MEAKIDSFLFPCVGLYDMGGAVMGIFSFLASSFMDGWRSGQQAQQPPARSTQAVPHTPHLFYPAILPRFDEITAGGHDGPRALVYSLSWLAPRRKRPFACGELNALDFGTGASTASGASSIPLGKTTPYLPITMSRSANSIL